MTLISRTRRVGLDLLDAEATLAGCDSSRPAQDLGLHTVGSNRIGFFGVLITSPGMAPGHQVSQSLR